MSESMKTWDLKTLSVKVAGLSIEDGAGEGSFVRIERPTKAFNVSEGADGSIVSWASGSKYVRIVINLLQSSAGNAVLSTLHQTDRATEGGILFPVLIRDRQGLDVLMCKAARIEGLPDTEYAQGVTNREWVIHGEETVGFVGGS